MFLALGGILSSLVAFAISGALKTIENEGLRLDALNVIDSVVYWPEKSQNHISVKLLHAFTNAVNHGYVFPSRDHRMPTRRLVFEVHAVEENGYIKLTVRDQGNGIDINLLHDLCKKRNFSPDRSQGQSEFDVLFLPRFA